MAADLFETYVVTVGATMVLIALLVQTGAEQMLQLIGLPLIIGGVYVNRWIIGEVVDTLAQLDKAFAELRFDDMADAVYHFTWGTFCDWYVELVKGAFDEETRAVAAWAFDQILVMLHPFCPSLPKEPGHSMGDRPYELIVAKWPEPQAQRDPTAAREIGEPVEVIDQVRATCAELNVPWSANLVPNVIGGDPGHAGAARQARGHAVPMAKLDGAAAADAVPHGSAQIVVAGVTIAFPLEGAVDWKRRAARLSKAVAAAEKDRDSLAARLANPAFTERVTPGSGRRGPRRP